MEQKAFTAQNKGMIRDLSISKFQNTNAYENFNIRVDARDNETFYSVSNERGQTLIENLSVKGTVLGSVPIDNECVIFTKDTDKDYIYLLKRSGTSYELEELHSGNLNFDVNCPIEGISSVESENVKKVYWVDGKNITRVINIVSDKSSFTDNSFDFIPVISGSVDVEITKEHSSSSGFAAGTTQYFMTFYNKYGQETKVFYQSDLLYNAFSERGASPSETVDCQYKITIKTTKQILNEQGIWVNNSEMPYDYVRIYSYVKSSDGIGAAYLVGDYALRNDMQIIDNGTYNTAIDPYLLLYAGGSDFVASTIAAKGNKLFLGNINVTEAEGSTEISNIIKAKCFVGGEFKEGTSYLSNCITFMLSDSDRSIPMVKEEGTYPYDIQLDMSSSQITSFKGGEKYRFAVQFTDAKGNTTRAYWIGDAENTLYPQMTTDGTEDGGSIQRVLVRCVLPSEVVSVANDFKYKKVTLLMAQATDNDRSVIAQGIVNPTVFNIYDRFKELNWARASWIMRFRKSKLANSMFAAVGAASSNIGEIQNLDYSSNEIPLPYYQEADTTNFDKTSYKIAIQISPSTKAVDHVYLYYTRGIYNEETGSYEYDCTDYPGVTFYWYYWHKKTIVESKWLTNNSWSNAYSKLKDAWKKLGLPLNVLISESDFKSIGKSTGYTVITTESASDTQYFTSTNRDKYFIDDSIITLNSPEIDNDTIYTYNTSSKFRIVGIAELVANTTSYNLNVSNSYMVGENTRSNLFSHTAISNEVEGLTAYPLYYDCAMTYNSDVSVTDRLKDTVLPSISKGNGFIYNVYIFGKEQSLMNYQDAETVYGQLTKKEILNSRFSYGTRYITNVNNAWEPSKGISYAGIARDVAGSILSLNTGDASTTKYYEGNVNTVNIKEDGLYNIKKYSLYGHEAGHDENIMDETGSYSRDPIKIKYNSSTHAVIALTQEDNIIHCIPGNIDTESDSDTVISNVRFPWKESYESYTIPSNSVTWTGLHVNNEDINPYVFIGELYRTFESGSKDTRYGGIAENAIENNVFVRASADYDLGKIIIGDRGDTYIQRYDCLKTKPSNESDIQQYSDITSVMLESHINLDGRYDTKRKTTNLLSIDTSNFAPVNSSYSVTDNLLTNSVLDEKYDTAAQKTQIVHSLVKTPNEDVDTWSNISLSAIVACEDQYGAVNKLLSYNNTIFAFQDKAIAAIPYNERTQITNSEGLPIEIANSNIVGDPSYITTTTGCYNKWSLVPAKSGIYFIDDINKTLVRFDGGNVINLGLNKGFNVWIRDLCEMDVWTPRYFGGFKSYYDNFYGDIYFYNGKAGELNTLCFNENLDEFTSFFNYGPVSVFERIWDKSISIKSNAIYENHTGEYGIIYGEAQDYYSVYNVVPDPFGDKIYTVTEYRANMYDSDTATMNLPFDTIEAWNDYQQGSANVKLSPLNEYPDAQRKFRIWRTDIPRDSKTHYGLNRIRSPWMHLKMLKKASNISGQRLELHDMTVRYFE